MTLNMDYVYLDHSGMSMVFEPRVLIGFHLNPRFIESRVGKTLNGTRIMWNPPFEVGFMV